jgi:hypothetical protein
MSQSPSSVAEGRKSWRGGPPAKLVRRSRNVWRWILSGLAILLLGYWVWWAFAPRPRLLLLTLGDQRQDRHILPPVPFAKDIEALLGWAGAANVPACELGLDEIGKLSRWAGASPEATPELQFSYRGNQRGKVAAPLRGDTLLVYIKGHGLAVDLGTEEAPDVQPVLIKNLPDDALAGDWLRSSSSVVKVGDLLGELAARSTVRVVLILDAAHLGYDPRLGVLANGFSEAVQQAMQKRLPPTAKNVWVVLGTSGGELSAAEPATGRSLLVTALIAALERKPGETKSISLDALLQEVKTGLGRQTGDPTGNPLDALALTPLLVEPPGGTDAMPELPRVLPTEKKGDDSKVPPSGGEPAKIAAAAAQRTGEQVVAANVPAPLVSAAQAIPAATTPAPGANSSAAPAAAGAPPTTPAGASPAAPPSSTAPPAAAAQTPTTTAPSTTAPAATAPATAPPTTAIAQETREEADLHRAWQLRDELLRPAPNQPGEFWSPIYVAPHWWRRLERVLVGFDEQLVGSRSIADSDQQLQFLLSDLEQLGAAMSGNKVPAKSVEGKGIAGAADRFYDRKNSSVGTPRDSFHSRIPSANAALKTFAEAAYRAVDYVRLHGRMLSVAGGTPDIQDDTGDLLGELANLRRKFEIGSDAERRLDDRRQQELEQLALRAANLCKQLDTRISNYAREIAAPPLSPGKLLRIRLLLESPLVRADDRQMLRRIVVRQSQSAAANEDADSSSGGNSPSADLAGGIRANLELWRSLLRILHPATESDSAGTGPNIGALPTGRDLLAWAPVGRKLREFETALPGQFEVERRRRQPKPADRISDADMLKLYFPLLGMDGRDASSVSSSSLVCLAQPLWPPRILDRVEVAFEPTPLPLSKIQSDGAELRLTLQVTSDNPPPYVVDLNLRWNTNDVRIVGEGREGELSPQKPQSVRLNGSERTLTYRVFPQREDASGAQTPLVATARFADAPPDEKQLACLLPRPNSVDFRIVSLRTGERASESLGDSGPGGRLLLFPNRGGIYRIAVQNLSSENLKLRARLYGVSGAGRLFNPDSPSRLVARFEALDAKIRSVPSGVVPDLPGPLLAQTADKVVIELPADDTKFVELPLEAVAPPPRAAPTTGAPPADDGISGLLLVLTSADGKEYPPYVKWIELAPRVPNDVFEIKSPTYRELDRRLSFRVGLVREADELERGQQPIEIKWDQRALPAGMQDGKFEAQLSAEDRTPELSAIVPENARWPLFVQLHIDGYPRALVAELVLDSSGGVKLNNWKRDRAPAVQLSRVGLSHLKTAYEIQPPMKWLPFPAVQAQPAENRPQRQRSDEEPIYAKLEGPLSQVPLTIDLQSDAAARDFTRGGALRLLVGNKESTFAADRQVNMWLTGIEGGALKLDNQATDWLNREFSIPVEAGRDHRVEIVAEFVKNGVRYDPATSRQQLTLVLDRNPPKITAFGLSPGTVNPLIKQRVTLSCRASDGNDGSGVEQVEFLVGLDANENGKLDPPLEIATPWLAEAAGNVYQADVEVTLPPEKQRGVFVVDAIVTDRVKNRAAVPALGSFRAEIPLPTPKNRSSYGKDKAKDEPPPAKKSR